MISQNVDERIESLQMWISVAGKALLGFYNDGLGVFWRDSLEKATDDTGKSPTSTLRSFVALIEFKRFLLEEQVGDDKLQTQVTTTLKGVSEKYLTNNPARKEVRMSGANGFNNFTDSHLLLASSLLPTLSAFLAREKTQLDIDASSVNLKLAPIANGLKSTLNKRKGLGLQENDLIHDFITLHAVRGLDAFFDMPPGRDWSFERKLQERVRSDVLRQLGFHAARITSRFDPSELAFSIVLMNRFPTAEAPQLTRRGVEAICQAQREGGWSPARPVVYSTGRLLHIVSYEVALALTQLAALQLANKPGDLADELIAALDASFEFARTAYSASKDARGWVNDHARSESLTESWTTAIVLMFFVHYRDVLLDIRQHCILGKYSVSGWRRESRLVWPDLVPTMRRPSWVSTNALDTISDPTDNLRLTKAIKFEIVEPIRHDAFFRPKKAALILHGLPGTRKTSLVQRVAETLGWPLLTVSPPDFLRREGLEGFEASAAETFEDLVRLRRVVVLFDECEDFFKRRPHDQEIESRTIGAFITSGMLPRLQSLREKKWILFVLATNSSLADLDDAVTRLGRFDWAHDMRHPTPGARVRYLDALIRKKPYRKEALRALADFASANDAQDVSFSQLDRLAKSLETLSPCRAGDVLRTLGEIVQEPSPPPLVPT